MRLLMMLLVQRMPQMDSLRSRISLEDARLVFEFVYYLDFGQRKSNFRFYYTSHLLFVFPKSLIDSIFFNSKQLYRIHILLWACKQHLKPWGKYAPIFYFCCISRIACRIGSSNNQYSWASMVVIPPFSFCRCCVYHLCYRPSR